jgi:twinkle protein
MIHEKHMAWIEARGLSPELATKLGIFTKCGESGNWLVLPYLEAGTPINHKHRLTSEKRHQMDRGAPLVWWNVDCLNDQQVQSPSHPVVITEGEWDAMAAMQSGRSFVLSVPNGAPSEPTPDGPISADSDAVRFAFLHRSIEATNRVSRFIIATDSDAPGRVLAYELVRRLGAERCMLATYPDGCKDLNDVLLAHGEGGVARILNDAKPYPVRGLYRLSDFPEPPVIDPIRIRLPELYDMLPVVPGTFSVVTGYAGQGKTSLVMAVVADLLKQGVHVALASFETAVKPILENQLRGHLIGCSAARLIASEIPKADAILEERLSIIAQQPANDDADMTLDDVLELARTAVIRDGVKLLIIDPWNEIEHKATGNESETDYTGRAIRTMKRFARQYQVALWLIAHPRKPVMDRGSVKAPTLYDISGSANFANKADYGVIIHRPNRDSNLVDIHVTKVRMGLPGRMGEVRLEWDWQRSRYEKPLSVDDDGVIQ